jgi:putative spermidine/putrescine transport system substrate-binding protein
LCNQTQSLEENMSQNDSFLTGKMSRRQVLKLGAAAGAGAFLAACGTPAAPAPKAEELLKSANTIPMDTLIAEAKKEGNLTTIALPHDWANYGELLDSFKTKYGIKINELNPDAGSSDELEAIRANKGNKGPQAPDTVDIGIGYADASKKEGLFAPYKVATWDTIPSDLKDPEGYWWAEYYGVLGFQVSKAQIKNIPQDWPDLLKPEYKGMVALAGDVLKSNEAVMAVWAAGISKTGKADQAAAEEGLKFWAQVVKAGNFVPVIGSAGTQAKGETPIILHWDCLGLADRDTLKGNPDVAGRAQDAWSQGLTRAISAYAPHLFAVRLWWVHLSLDEGQLMWLKDTPTDRFNDLVARNKVPADLAAKLPPAESSGHLPDAGRASTRRRNYITENWRAVVLGE